MNCGFKIFRYKKFVFAKSRWTQKPMLTLRHGGQHTSTQLKYGKHADGC